MSALIKAAGALGLLVGLGVPLVATAAAIGIILFFVGAVAALALRLPSA